MENCKFIIKNKKFILLFAIFNAVFLFSYIFAYSPYYTHPDLTEEIAKLWNFKNNNQDLKISQNEIEWMRQGAIDEDKPARWINHFYDPVHKTGWSGKHFGDRTQEQGLYEGELMSPRPAITSIDWATNQEYQSAYGRQYGNQTWQKAIKSYIDGDRKSAFIALGHILHLIEDASVPDHTRDDTHADLYGDPGSPYEKYSKEYTNLNKLNIAENLKNKEIVDFSTIQDAFNYLANYSNNNFFSEDTISNEEFDLPNLNNLESKTENINNEKVLFLYDKQKQIYLAVLNNDEKYSTNDKSFIPFSYFNNLAPQAVLTGASVMDLFFKEAEKYKNNPPEIVPDSSETVLSYLQKSPRLAIVNAADLKDKIETNASIYASKIINQTTVVINNTINETTAVINNTVDGVKNIFSIPQIQNPLAMMANIGQVALQTATSNQQLAVSNEQSEIASPLVGQEVRNDSPVLEVEAATQIQQNQSAEVEPLNLIDEVEPRQLGEVIIHAPYQKQEEIIHAPWSGNKSYQSKDSFNDGSIFMPTGQYPNIYINSPPPQENQVNNQSIEEIEFQEQEPPEQDIIPPEKPIITTNNSQNFTVLTAEIILEGVKTEDAKEILINDSSENIIYPETTSWQKSITLLEGENIFEVKAKDEAGNISESATINIIFKEPLINFYLADYDAKKMNFTLNWGDENSVIKDWELEYKLAPNFEWIVLANSSSLIANSFDFTVDYDDMIYQFRLRGKDVGGNFSDWLTLETEIFTKPVVINEIAWMGTQASSSDEWIELYNKTSRDIDLAGWILESPDGSPKIEFDENYKNKVKTNEGKIPTIKAKSYFLLERTNDETTSEEGDWFFSGALNDINLEKDEEERKQVEGLVLKYGDEVMDQIDLWYAGEKSGKKSMERISPFYSGNDPDNWKDNDEKKFNGKDAKENDILGTPKQKNSAIKIINGEFDRNMNFYAFPDVEYLISDFKLKEGYSLTAHPGAVLKFKNNGKLEIKGALFAKGAKDNKIYFTSENDDLVGSDINADGNSLNPDVGDWDGVYIEDSAEAQLEWVEMKYAYSALSIDSSDVQISNSLISYFDDAVYSQNGNLTVLNNIFEGTGDSNAIYTSGGTLTLKDNVFRNNKIPLYVDYKTDLINSGNIAEENDYTGIFLYSEDDDYKYDFNRTLHKDLPYIFVRDLVIEDGAELTLEPGVVIKFGKFSRDEFGIDIYGKLIAQGTPADKITITSFNDDFVGGEIFKGNHSGYTADYWGGLNFNFGSQDSLIENFVLRKSDDGMYFDGVTMNLTGVEIADSKDDGIIGHNSVLNFKDSHFTDIKGNGFVVYSGSVTFISSTVMENIDGDVIVVFRDSALTLENSLIKNFGGDGGDAVIVFNNSVVDIINSVLKNGENDGIVIFDDSAVNINNSTLENFQGRAVLVADDDIIVNIEDSIIKNNDYGMYVFGDSLVNVSDNAIYDNSQYGIFNYIAENTNIISAQNNWWGDSSGPYHPELNESGVGDNVSDGVDFAPWTENSGE